MVHIASKQIKITDLLYLKVRVKYKQDFLFEEPVVSSQVYAPFISLKDPQFNAFADEKGFKISEAFYQLEPRFSDKYQIQAFEVVVTSLDGSKTLRIKTDSISILVTPDKMGSNTKTKEIEGKIQVPYNFIPLITTSFFILGILILFFLLKKKSPTNHTTEKHVAGIQYDKWALEALNTLKNQELIKKGQVKKFHTKLSWILRRYIEKHLGIKAEGQTTQEFLTTTANTLLFDNNEKLLREYLNLSDLVKFAAFHPDPDVSQGAYLKVYDFIITTHISGE